ncbi:MAG: B12-binding domain-containing radical SAM protein [Pirellulales bacterium]|nr:B12-binding domain-containing radical SAM protein [Pirellulales bacterium]
MHLQRRIKHPRFLLAYPPLQFTAGEIMRPDGTLALPYLHAALRAAGFDAQILDMSLGTQRDRLEETFYCPRPVAEEMVRIGMSPERILEEVRDFDVIAISSIFTQQTSRCFEVSQLVKRVYPEKLIIGGGVNARSLKEQFFAHGFDAVFLSEGEKPIVQFARWMQSGTPTLAEVSGIAFSVEGRTVVNPVRELTHDLDEYPMPSWEALPNERYWQISRLFGGKEGWIGDDELPRYAAMITSRGCPFRCTYCHISKERGGEAGDIGDLRLHSIERVEQEFDHLKRLGVDCVYINDDSFLAKKNRVFAILDRLRGYGFKLADVNGVNIIHLFKRYADRLIVDEELIEALCFAGFRRISLPFESGTQRIIDRYSSSKWQLDSCDVVDLIKKLNKVGIVASGNFMIGYPDETPDELTNTYLLARKAMDAGLVACAFFMVQPFPGTRLFDESLANGQLPASWHWDELGWSKGSPFTRPLIDKEALKYSWSLAWRLLNRESRVQEYERQLAPFA